MTTFRDVAENLALRAVTLPIRLLPRGLALALGAGLGELGWRSRVRRGLVLGNLARAFPDAGREELLRVGRAAAHNLGRTVAEFVRFAGRDRRRVSELVAIEGLEELGAALAGGQGALVVTAHLGAWALYATALAAAGVPTTLLVGKQRNPLVDRFILGIPGDAVRFVSKGKRAPRELLESLGQGQAVVMVADHYSSSEAVWAPFLGHVASTLPLPGALIAKHRTPLFLMTGVREDGGRHRLRLRPLELPPGLAADSLRLAVATLCNRELGEEILRHPEQYWWYHDRWKVRGSYRKQKRVYGQPPETTST